LSVNPIEIRDLVIRYRRGWWNAPVTAVDGLSLEVAPGAVVGFLGPNGAGKSSTLKVLMGFQRPASGTAHVFGHAAGSLEARRRTGFLPEVALYYPFLTPREALFLYGRVQGLAGGELTAEVARLLEEVGLDEHQHRRLGTFSKGMLQRLGIAQALLGEPDLLILDEVTSGLDPVGRRQLRDIVLRRRERGTTIFFSSHELAEVTAMCDRIILVDQGRVVEERDLSELSVSLRRYWIRFRDVGERGSAMSGLEKWEGEAPAEPGATVFHAPPARQEPRPPTANTPSEPHAYPFRVESDPQGSHLAQFESRGEHLRGLEWLRSHGGEILDVGQSEGALEEYFVAAVGGAER
jgi:ABC-2 type transport system ATP-binding protein